MQLYCCGTPGLAFRGSPTSGSQFSQPAQRRLLDAVLERVACSIDTAFGELLLI
jgi:hypothetical protein